MAKQTYKLTDRKFLNALRLNNGDFAVTAKYIERKHGITYTRQAVHERAKNFKEEVDEMRWMAIDYSESRLMRFLDDETCPKSLRAKVAMHMIDTICKHRKYTKLLDGDL